MEQGLLLVISFCGDIRWRPGTVDGPKRQGSHGAVQVSRAVASIPSRVSASGWPGERNVAARRDAASG